MTNLFKVDGQTLTPVEIYPAVSDTVNYLTFAFMFSYDWAGLTKSAIFTKGTDVFEVVLTDDQVLESDHVNLSAGTWSISVVGDLVVDAVVTRQITTTSYDYTVTQSGATSGGVFPPSVASQVYVNVNQATPQRFVGGILKLAADRVISDDNDLVDKKHVADVVATVTADDFNHNDLSNKQGGTTNEFYHVTAAEKTVIQNTSGTNTGDQDVSGAISTHNTDAGAHASLTRKSETMRLLISRTIQAGENVSAITWTQDDAGNPLSLREVRIVTSVPANSKAVGTSGDISLRINDQAGGSDYQRTNSLQSSIIMTLFRTDKGYGDLNLIKANGYLFGVVNYTYSDGITLTGNIYQYNTNFTVNTITKLYAYISGLTYFPVGTTIDIYWRTA